MNKEQALSEQITMSKLLIINHESLFIQVWRFSDIFVRMISSYIYMWLTCFGQDTHWNVKTLEIISLTFEAFFLMSMGIKFTTSFVIQGEAQVIKSHKKIAQRYINSDFLLDFIPLLPTKIIFMDNMILG